nr:MAG TPA: Deltaretrovirus Tax protein [Caudoviricetes sp.]
MLTILAALPHLQIQAAEPPANWRLCTNRIVPNLGTIARPDTGPLSPDIPCSIVLYHVVPK